MPDLSAESVHAFWHEYDAKILYKIVCSLEASETWVPIDEEIESILQDLGDVIDSISSAPQLSPEKIINILTSIKYTQSLRVMHAIETKTPGFVSSLLIWAEDQKNKNAASHAVQNFLRRNLVFERLQLLARIFSSERINLLNKAQEVSNAS
jgi:intracellular multiplication protein IcmW